MEVPRLVLIPPNGRDGATHGILKASIRHIPQLLHLALDAPLHHALPLLGVDVSDFLHGYHTDLLDHYVVEGLRLFQWGVLMSDLAGVE